MPLYEPEYELGIGLLLSASVNEHEDWAAMIPRAGTPLLVGPDSTEADVSGDDAAAAASNNPVDDDPGQSTAPTSSKEPDHTRTTESPTTTSGAAETPQSSSADDTSTSPPSSTTDAASTSTEPASSITSAQQTSTVDGPKSIQLTSLAYLVPIFLLVAATIGIIIYRKCHACKRIDREASSRFHSPAHAGPQIPHGHGHGWKQVDVSDDEDDDEKQGLDEDGGDLGVLQVPAQWQMKESKSRPGLMDVSYGNGSAWLKGPKWKSARTLDTHDDNGSVVAFGRSQPAKTMKLVAPAVRSSTTYQSLANGTDTPDASGQGSRRGWKDSLRSFAHQLTPTRKQLERNKSPNKRRAQHPVSNVAPPEAPDWIRPRAASPVSQVLSPPMQPHLFFQPPTANSHSALQVPSTPNTESECTYTDTDSRPASSMFRPSQVPISPGQKVHSIGTSSKATASTEDLDKTPTRASYIAKAGRRLTPTRSSSSDRRQQGISRASEWATTSPKIKVTPASSARSTVTGSEQTTAVSPSKTRKERREAKTRERVESILQASWSDRALSSHSSPSSDSLVSGPFGTSSSPQAKARLPGSTSRDHAGVSGIEARLAMFKPAQ